MIKMDGFTFWVAGEPVPKSTMKPPKSPKAYWIVQNDDYWLPLRKTWAYQSHVKDSAIVVGCPFFQTDDPIKLSFQIYKSGHRTGDTKNILAAVEDGLQFGGIIPNDRQVTGYGGLQVYFGVGKDKAGVRVAISIDPMFRDFEWLKGWLKTAKKARAYWQRMGVNDE